MLRPLLAALTLTAAPALADPDPGDWPGVVAEAEGQTVYWHAWGGSSRINAFIGWVGEQVAGRHGITLEHVKVADIAESVSRVLAERAAGRDEGGAVDLMWINGENFAAMKRNGLLFGPWAEDLPNWTFVDVEGKPAVTADFTVPTEGLESPWGMAQLVFYYDSARLEDPPYSVAEILDFARANPGRFAYPAPPDYLGSTFLKQALYELLDNPDVLAEPAPEGTAFEAATAPLWSYLEDLHPVLWRQGRAWPQNESRLRQLMADGEIDLAFSFNPNEAASAIANFELPETVRSYTLSGGTIGNAHFVAIPYNASAKAAAMVVADFLLSPEAQARAADPEIWGSTTVLDVTGLPPADKARFAELASGPGAITAEELGPSLPEPHPSWMEAVEAAWLQRYAGGQ
jgi:putative thiamine transport system substrate-binding protein